MLDRLPARSGLTEDEDDYLNVLLDLVEQHEDKRYPIERSLAATHRGTWSSPASRRKRPSTRSRGCPSRRCQRSSWADAGSIRDTSASWPASSASLPASSSTPQTSWMPQAPNRSEQFRQQSHIMNLDCAIVSSKVLNRECLKSGRLDGY